MQRVDLYARVRYAVMIDGQSQREAAGDFGIDPRTVKKKRHIETTENKAGEVVGAGKSDLEGNYPGLIGPSVCM